MPGGKSNKNQRLRGKRKETLEINPFELKINRQKYDILGRKIMKTEKGMPGASRSKAVHKRKESLLVEYKKFGRGNKVIDKRIGENDSSMSYDEKMAKRFALEREQERDTAYKQLDSDSEEEGNTLTHFGQSLADMESFKDPVMSDDDDDNDSDNGRISAQVVGSEHFGGFLTKRAAEPNSENVKAKTWKEKMEEVIARSKLAKFERQSERERALTAVKNVDNEWKELQMLMSAIQRNRETEQVAEVKKSGDYDVVMRQLQFDLKSQATDRLKSPEELAKEEKELLEKLEAERLKRMHGYVENKEQKHFSADDLSDGLVYDLIDKETQSDDDDEEGDDVESSGNGTDAESDDDDNSDSDSYDNLSDLETVGKDIGDPCNQSNKQHKERKTEVKKSVRFAPSVEFAKEEKSSTQTEVNAAADELPYTFAVPGSVEALCELLDGHTIENRLTIITRIIKCHHPSLGEGNKAKLEAFFHLLLRYFGKVALRQPFSPELIDGLTKHIYALTQMSPAVAGQEMAAILFQLHKKMASDNSVVLNLNVLMHLKLVGVLFPTSDRRHPVVTPAMLLMSRILHHYPICSAVDVAAGLFICTLFADYVSVSKRLIPDVVSFLCGVLFMARDHSDGKANRTPAIVSRKNGDLLALKNSCCRLDSELICLSISDLLLEPARVTDVYRVQCIALCLQLVCQFASLYSHLPAFREIFGEVQDCVSHLPVDHFPQEVQSLHKTALSKLNPVSIYTPICKPACKPQPLKLLEPRIREEFTGKKKLPKTVKEKQLLKKSHKREVKGALREIRRDTQFIARQKLSDQLERDAERKLKVKRLFSDLAQQEGDFRALKKTKSA